MRLRTITLKDFKRFDDLTIDLGDKPKKLVALVGPNGCGKSSVFDAFESILQNSLAVDGWQGAPDYYSKRWYDAQNPAQQYDKGTAIKLVDSTGNVGFGSKSFYVRSPYRYTPNLRVNAIQAKVDPLSDTSRPGSTVRLDQRLQSNYERMQGRLLSAFWQKDITGADIRKELVSGINARLARVLEIQITELGNVAEGRGQLFFEKGGSKDFPFENLSAGEKEVVDMIIDLVVKAPTFNDTVYAIDEPELHLNTAIQRKLLKELADLVPNNCQLWVATHSVGFLRALQKDLADHAQILDFSERDYFTGAQTIRPIAPTRANWKRIFATALEDLSGLIAPNTIIYCEGRPDPSPSGTEQGLDARVYNTIFEQIYPDVLFISSGGSTQPAMHSELALKILAKAFDGMEMRLLKDLDTNDQVARTAFLAAAAGNRMLKRREIENYLFDPEVLAKYAASKKQTFDEDAYKQLVSDIDTQDLKPIQQKLVQLVGANGAVSAFKIALAPHISADTKVFAALEACVF